MNTLSMVSPKPFQRLQPLSLLAQLISRHINGCLEVVSGDTSWLIYFSHGKLCFATSLTDAFERLDRHLRSLQAQISALTDEMCAEARSRFEGTSATHPATSADYQAICWLVERHGLDRSQATSLIEALAKEVIESFLSVTEGMYEITEPQNFTDYPNLCQLDLRAIVEYCHSRRRQSPAAYPVAPKSQSPEAINHRAPGAVEKPQATRQFAASLANRSKPAAPEIAPKTSYTIACIDDSPTILQAINSFLDDDSFSVLMISDPVKALMQVVRSKPDVILLDVGMPNLDGYELCSLLRRHPNFKNTPIIMVTGHTGFIDRAKAKLVGASGYLTKPFTQSDLLKTMFKHLT